MLGTDIGAIPPWMRCKLRLGAAAKCETRVGLAHRHRCHPGRVAALVAGVIAGSGHRACTQARCLTLLWHSADWDAPLGIIRLSSALLEYYEV